MNNYQSQTCRRCHGDIPEARSQESLVICPHCGWTNSINSRVAHNELQNRTIRTLIIFSIFISLVYIHSVQWGSHAVEVIPLKVKSRLGVGTSYNYQRLADICNDRLKISCELESLREWVRLEPHNLEAVARYGQTLEGANKDSEALAIYSHYFLRGGNHIDIAYNYARLLDTAGQFADAKKYYEFVLQVKPDIFQVTVAKDYVTLLIRNNQLQEAKDFILKVRKKGENAPFFMDKELQEIKKRLVVAAR